MSASDRDNLEALWEDLLKPIADPELYKKDRAAAALQVIRILSLEYASENNEAKEIAAQTSFGLLQLIATDILAGLSNYIDEFIFRCSETASEAEAMNVADRFRVIGSLAIVKSSIPPLNQSSLDVVLVPLQRSTFVALQDAIEALNSGEILPLLKPASTTRKGRPWSHDREKVRAVQHVRFLCGQGMTKGIARKQVSVAMKNVSEEALREWEETRARDVWYLTAFAHADEAGKLYSALRVDPAAWDAENSVHANVGHLLEEFEREDLKTFGERYFKDFGVKHRS